MHKLPEMEASETIKQLVVAIATRPLSSSRLTPTSKSDRVVHLQDNRLSPSGARAPNSVCWGFTRVVFGCYLKACIFYDAADWRLIPLATAVDQARPIGVTVRDRSVCTQNRMPFLQKFCFTLIISSNFCFLFSIPLFVMTPQRTLSLLSQTSTFFTKDKERVSKSESTSESSAPHRRVSLQTHPRVHYSTRAASFQTGEE